MDEVLVEDRPDGVRILRLNRPERLNALTPGMVAGECGISSSCRD